MAPVPVVLLCLILLTLACAHQVWEAQQMLDQRRARAWLAGGLIGAMAVVATIFATFHMPARLLAERPGATGFGPEWQCAKVPNAEAVCFKTKPR